MPKLLLALLLSVSCHLFAQQQRITITIKEPNDPGGPKVVQLAQPGKPGQVYRLTHEKTQKRIYGQLQDSSRLVLMTDENMPVGDHVYTIAIDYRPRFTAPVTIEKKNEGLLVKVKNKPLFFYHIREAMPPADSPAYYRRSGFIHPLYSPSGKVLTDDFPVGHLHQHGIFTAWTSTRFRNTSVDFWNQQNKKGTVEHVKLLGITEGPVFSQIKTQLRYKSHAFGEVLQEIWTLTIYPVDGYFLFDLESLQQNVSTDTLFLNKYHYGGLALRGNRQWNPDDKVHFKSAWNVLTSEGLKDSSANATHARWVDASGYIDQVVAGVAVFNHPSNFRYPQALRVHPTMPYWAFAPMVDGEFFIAPRAFYHSKFRYFVHDGVAAPARIESLFASW